jgi:hypothetical protein
MLVGFQHYLFLEWPTWQLKGAIFYLASVVVEENLDPDCKKGKRCVLKLELLIAIEQKEPPPGPNRKMKKLEWVVTDGQGPGRLDLHGGGGSGEEAEPAVMKNK